MIKKITTFQRNFSKTFCIPVLTWSKKSKHTLPKLEYPIEKGLPPCISPKQLDFHYNKHHNTYVEKLNGLIKGTKFEDMSLVDTVKETARQKQYLKIFQNSAQHFNHSLFWRCMKPGGTSIPAPLEKRLIESFGSVENFKKEVCFDNI